MFSCSSSALKWRCLLQCVHLRREGDGGRPRGDEWSRLPPLPLTTLLHRFAADHLLFGHREGGGGLGNVCVCVGTQ